jgi:heat shock protein HslJ
MPSRTLVVCCVLAVALGACGGSDEAPTSPELWGSAWGLVEIPVAGDGLRPIPDGVTIDLRFEGGRVVGSAGCNTYWAPVVQDGSTLRIGEVTLSSRACAVDVMATEDTFLAQLARVSAFRGGTDRLTLVDANDTDLLRFDPA